MTAAAEVAAPTAQVVGVVPRHIGQVAVPVRAVRAVDRVADVEILFRAPACQGVVVRDGDGAGRVGLLTRHRFTEVMTGRLGYGRAVLARRVVGEVADWTPLVLDASTSVVDAARAAMARDAAVRHDDVLVPGPSWSAASTADLVQALTAAVADRSARDPLTGTLSRAHLVATTARWASDALPGTQRRLLLAAVDVVRMDDVNATHGLAAGDALLRALADRVTAVVPEGGVVARLDGDAFAALVLLPAVHEDRAREVGASLRQRLHGACAGLGVDVRVAVTASVAGWADPGLLLLEVERELRSTRTHGAPTPSAPLSATLPTRH
ncbi:GGDEF domain-containing protein [Cellulomonas sp. FA1]|uniref:GGDEF domain-containing protein n=1 Tax=Cellulomonas sp. FA1 TaxID=1346710 RepID=UPI00069C0489|nr:GGDEF domain-containing protein [Cellulomonas sp. FA1]